MFVPEKLFLFEIDEQYLHARIRIEVQNDHNNYTNGFMTRFSYLKFHIVFLLPSFLLEHKNWMRIYNRFGEINQLQALSAFNSSMLYPRVPASEVFFQPDPMQGNELWVGHIMGGSFSMEIPLSKKHGITHLGKLSPGRLAIDTSVLCILSVFGLLNTYT